MVNVLILSKEDLMSAIIQSRKPVISATVVEHEEQAQVDQQALMVRGMVRTPAKKTFRDFIISRPKNPFMTLATESMAAALEEHPTQDNGQAGALVSMSILSMINPAILLPVVLDQVLIGSLLAYKDGSCILLYPEAAEGQKKGIVRICTLPLTLKSRQVKMHGSDEWVKVRVRAGTQRMANKGLVVEDYAGDVSRLKEINCTTDWTKASAVDLFKLDICKEVKSLIEQTEIEAPRFSITVENIGLIASDAREDEITLHVGPSVSRGVSPPTYAWLKRKSHSIFDLHLPSISLMPDQMAQMQKVGEAATRLALRRAGISAEEIAAELHVEAASILQGDFAKITLRQGMQHHMQVQMGPPMPPVEKLQAFMEDVTKLLTKLANMVEIQGFQYLYRRGEVGSWAPFIPIAVCFSNLAYDAQQEEADEAVLEKRLEFEMHKAMLMFK
jgi:hypothetical protein